MPAPTQPAKAVEPSSFAIQVPCEKCEPNTWNPNKMPPEFQMKLEEGIKQVLAQSGRIPPITVRKHPEKKDKYQIIDGYHRWAIYKKLKLEKIDAFVLEVDDSMARILTGMLNYVRGEVDPEKYPILIAEALAAKDNLTYTMLARLLPEDANMLEELVASSEAALSIIDAAPAVEHPEGEIGPQVEDRWVNINFSAPLEVAGIVEKELDRIADRLTGKNRRIRALEYMAINSALTPLDDVAKTVEAEEKRRGAGKDEVKSAGFTSDVATEENVEDELRAKAQKKFAKKKAASA